MSASKQKKLRQQQREQGVEKHQLARQEAEKKAKRSKIRNTIIGIIVALCVIAVILLNSNLLYRNFSAVTVGGESYNASELSFFYNLEYSNFINQNSSALPYLGLDTSKSLKSQSYGEGQTWSDFFREAAGEYLHEVTMLTQEAQKAGFEMSEDDRAALEEELSSLDTISVQSGYPNVDSFLAANYGKGCNYKLVSTLMEKIFVASAYAQYVNDSYEYSAGELESQYLENKDSYDNYSFVSYYASGSADEDADEEKAMAEAKKLAESLIRDAETEDEFINKASALSDSEVDVTKLQGSSLASAYSEWMQDPARKEGDKTIAEADNGYYALYFLSRDGNETKTVSARHILVYVEADDNGEYSNDAKTEAKKKAEDILSLWKSEEATEESFAALANEYSDDTGSNTKGGLYEEFKLDSMVKEFNDWCFDKNRRSGDTGIVFNDGSYTGYHIIYFVGEGRPYREILSDSALRNADFTEWKTAALENYTVQWGFTSGLVS